MKKQTRLARALTGLLLIVGGFSEAFAQHRDRTEIIYAFRNYSRPAPIRMILVGEIRSKIKVAKPRDIKSPYVGYDTREDQVTVKVVNRKGLKVGQKLFIIDKNPYHKKFRNGLVVGEITVRAVFFHPFFGHVLTGTGILLRVREGMFVARTLDTENLARAFERKRKGDFYYQRGDKERALSNYYAALEADRALPGAHSALGRVYLEMDMAGEGSLPVRALSEFQLAWRNRRNFRYKYDEYRFYLDYMKALYFAYSLRRFSATRGELLVNYLDKIRMVGNEALRIKGDDRDVLLNLGRAEYYRMTYLVREPKALNDTRKKAADYLKQVLSRPGSEPEPHRTAFLFYFSLYDSMRRASDGEKLYRASRPLIYYSPDFTRWEDGEYTTKSRGPVLPGRERLKRLLLYHYEKYNLYLDRSSSKPDPEVRAIYRRL